MKRILTIFILSLGVVCAQAQSYADSLESRSTAERITESLGALAVNASVTELLKNCVHEMRPDRSGNNSFPSRHTSWAFAASTVVSNELYRHSPWWSLAAQAGASGIGYWRVADRRHYASDVIWGAFTGIASTELVYVLGHHFFGTPQAWNQACENDFRPTAAVVSGALYNFRRGWCTGFCTGIDVRIPVLSHYGIGLEADGSITPVKTAVYPLKSITALVGPCCHFALPVTGLAAEAALRGGASRLIDGEYDFDTYSFTAMAQFGLSWRFTDRFAARAEAGYRYWPMSTGVSAITVSLSSVAVF